MSVTRPIERPPSRPDEDHAELLREHIRAAVLVALLDAPDRSDTGRLAEDISTSVIAGLGLAVPHTSEA